MNDENNATTARPTEQEMNDMHRKAWLDYHADAQADKQKINRAYAIMINTHGNYKKIPYGVKELLKKNYENHEAKWGENGTEMQKRFGKSEEETKPDNTLTETTQEITSPKPSREGFLQKIQLQRNQSEKTLEYDI